MKIRYDREKDIALIELSYKKIDHAQETSNIIIHFSKDDEPVLLEIIDASEFLTEVTRATIKSDKEEPIKISVK